MEHIITKQDGEDLVETLRHKTREFAGEYPKLSEITGIHVRWIRAFSQGQFDDPGVKYLAPLAHAMGISMAVFSKQQPAARKLLKEIKNAQAS
jgi:hypothetical protein